MDGKTLGDLYWRVISQQSIKHSSGILDIYSIEEGEEGSKAIMNKEKKKAHQHHPCHQTLLHDNKMLQVA